MKNRAVKARLPAFFNTSQVVKAYRGTVRYRAVIQTLKRIGAIEDFHSRPMRVDPQILRDELPTIFHRCVEIIMEEQSKKTGET